MKKPLLLATLSLFSFSSAYSYEAMIKKGQMDPSLEAMLAKASAETGFKFETSNTSLIEERELATSNYEMYVQTSKFIPVKSTAIRIWKDKKSGELILAEIHLNEKHKADENKIAKKYEKARLTPGALKSNQLSSAIHKMVEDEVLQHGTDSKIISMKFQDYWIDGDLVREVEVRGGRGMHKISISLLKNIIVKKSYSVFPQAEAMMTLKANVFPMYEEVEGTGQKLDYEVRELKYINSTIVDGGDKPLKDLGDAEFKDEYYNPLLAETEIGQAYGIWSDASLRRQIEAIITTLPEVSNDLSSGLLLQGKYATINLHPSVKKSFSGIDFNLRTGVNHLLNWQQVKVAKPKVPGQEQEYEMRYQAFPITGFYGKGITSEDELLTRIPFRLPDHNPTAYINSGFDEAQVYYAVTTLMESLGEMGFTDPELSTKPFHAFLYDPDITMRDNAYYTDNTINFTTYSPSGPNLARDNPTIWHELGHGVMDRLMGAHLSFGESGYGGLSEGMADFVAKLIVEHQTKGTDFPGKYDFRIMNNTGLYVTNEYHDDGEAYGGAMNDMLAAVVKLEGRKGLFAFTDLTLEAMRLTRNHPGLSASLWFEHMLYADELGSSVRAPGQYSALIHEALADRNFSFSKDFKPAKMKIETRYGVLTESSMGSRNVVAPICDVSESTIDMTLSLTSGDSQFIKFPAIVKVEYKKGALQGAVNWEGEEANPTVYEIASAEDALKFTLKPSMTCESSNQPDGSCTDYAYIQVFNQGATKPAGKMRFYVHIPTKEACVKYKEKQIKK